MYFIFIATILDLFRLLTTQFVSILDPVYFVRLIGDFFTDLDVWFGLSIDFVGLIKMKYFNGSFKISWIRFEALTLYEAELMSLDFLIVLWKKKADVVDAGD